MNAMNVPLPETKTEAWKAWIEACTITRRTEFDDFNERMGLTEHRVWLDTGSGGPQVIVMHGGPGAGTFMKKLATSDHPFDAWFRDNIIEFHGMDFSKPMTGEPPINMIDWKSGAMTREAESG